MLGIRIARRDIGRRGERAAARFLKTRGYRICARNVRNRFGEIDLLALEPDGRTMVIVEVKSGQAGSTVRPEIHITADKRRRLISLAAQLARRHGLTRQPWRFDVVAVQFGNGREKPAIRHHRGAFEAR